MSVKNCWFNVWNDSHSRQFKTSHHQINQEMVWNSKVNCLVRWCMAREWLWSQSNWKSLEYLGAEDKETEVCSDQQIAVYHICKCSLETNKARDFTKSYQFNAWEIITVYDNKGLYVIQKKMWNIYFFLIILMFLSSARTFETPFIYHWNSDKISIFVRRFRCWNVLK